ncbi:MAG TPA: PAS domain S-box protein, partial [Gammaproteobacteria bacterium]|nr:PAS domain S-box protein [Gammaproteobacteria bacterium]
DALPQLVCQVDNRGHVLRANRTLETWGLGKVTAVRGTPVHDLLHPGCRDGRCNLKENWEQAWRQLQESGGVEFDYRDESPGRSLHLHLCRSDRSHCRGAREAGRRALLIVEDVTRREQAAQILQNDNAQLESLVQERTRQLALTSTRLRDEIEEHLCDRQSLVEAKKKYTCLLETTLTGFYVIEDDRIVYCNRRFAEIFGYPQEAVRHLDMQRLFPPAMAADMPAAGEHPDQTGEVHIARGIHRNGNNIWLQRSLTRLDCLSKAMTLGNIIDVTAQRNAEIELECMLCDKKRLSEKILTAQESERKQIAGELHDSIGQSISAIKFSLENLLHDHGGSLQKSVRQSLAGTVGRLRDTVEEVRKISMNLRPSMLDDLGLLATLSWFNREFRSMFPDLDIEAHIEVEEDEIPAALKVVIFRILQEALNNISKHADAGRVVVKLGRADEKLSFSIADNGRGFAPEDMQGKWGFGLGSMRERANLSGGKLEILSTPGSGTLIRADWLCGQ